MPEISIIIPVYNSEPYISECIESILHQSFRNFEIILINDGSTDNSERICRQYEKTDSRIKVISQSNAGVCAARNIGLDNAAGNMISFVDSDDWLPENGLELLFEEYKRAEADLVIGDIVFFESGKTRLIRVFDKSFVHKDKAWINEYQRACIGYGYNPNPGTKMNVTGLGSMGNKLYRRSIIESAKLRFDPYTLGIYEDNLFVLHYLEYCKTVSYLSEAVYYYRKVGNSNSRGFKARTLEINDRIFSRIEEFIHEYKSNMIDDFHQALYIYIIRRLDGSLSVFFFAKDNDLSFHTRIKELKKLLLSEPYNTALSKVDPSRLNPKNHKITWLTAKTRSAILVWLSYESRMAARRMLSSLAKMRIKNVRDVVHA